MMPPKTVEDQFIVAAATGEASGQLRVHVSLWQNDHAALSTVSKNLQCEKPDRE